MFSVKEISKEESLKLIQQYHYSNSLPKINKHFLGFYKDDKLVGTITLGLGTRPLHTIARLFPSLTAKDYYEIGRMCMLDEMPRNSETQMIKACIRWIKENEPQIKILFTWADGMLAKPGYVYQAASFIYAGYVDGEMYLKDGIKIHVRQMKQFLAPNDKRLTVRPTLEQMQELKIDRYKGKQFRYIKFLCSKTEKKRLLKEYTEKLDIPYPKIKDLSWRKKDVSNGKWIMCDMPEYISDIKEENKNRRKNGNNKISNNDSNNSNQHNKSNNDNKLI